MSNLVNLFAETGADLVGDDTSPTLTIRNTGGGPGLRVEGLVLVSSASIDQIAITTISNANTTVPALTISKSVVGNLSIGVLRVVGNSIASGAMLEFSGKGAYASITSVVLTTVANTDYAIRVQVGLETRWIPLFKDAAIIGAAAFT